MINYQSNRQLSLTDFILPFSGSLDGNNRWVREVVAQIQENPYLQYFLGYEEYCYRQVFDPSLLVTIRKRLDRAAIAELTRVVAECHKLMEEKVSKEKAEKSDASDGDEGKENGESSVGGKEQSGGQPVSASADGDSAESENGQSVTHRGELIIDATAAELEIPYPTDLGLLNEARLQSERMIDVLWSVSSGKGKKPRTYRRKAKRAYLSVSKKRQRSRKIIRKGIKQQLQYLRRNIRSINKLLDEINPHLVKVVLKRRDRQLIKTIAVVYEQQQTMYKEKSHRIKERIVNLYQPWVRPIKRGKAGSDVEFGPKLSVSLVEETAYVVAAPSVIQCYISPTWITISVEAVWQNRYEQGLECLNPDNKIFFQQTLI